MFGFSVCFVSFLSSEDGSSQRLPDSSLFSWWLFVSQNSTWVRNKTVSLLCHSAFERRFCFCLTQVIQTQTWSRKNKR